MHQKNKPIVSCRGIEKTFGEFIALKGITFSLQSGEKIGLVGSNGSGKSTLLKIIAGLETQDTGVIERATNLSIGYIPQIFESAHGHEDLKHAPERYLRELHLSPAILDRPLQELSGGEKTKLAILRLLISDHDLYLLDEPTNNLDIEALSLIETFVSESKKTFIIVSHDRMFLDRTISKVIGLDPLTKEATIYDGNFSAYMQQREAEIEREWKEYEDSIEVRKKMEKNVDQKMKRASKISKAEPRDNDKMAHNFKTEMSQATLQRGARLVKDKLEKLETKEKPTTLRPLNVVFDIAERSGDKVFEMKAVTKQLPEKILGPIDLTIRYGERVLLTGKNGAGKSTIIKMLMGQLAQDSGSIEKGTKLSIGYLAQEESFAKELSTLEVLKQESGLDESTARKTLSRFRISEEDLDKPIAMLSSGERSRFLISLMMIKQPNCIILDEPSNHLDLEVLTELEKGLVDFSGTLIVVSHDRYFVEKLHFNKKYMLDTTLKEAYS
jgi:macrolide transport system ATP-binding/permease protein